jgi:hypothetical protein
VPTIAELVALGRLERIDPDRGEAVALCGHALAHLASAAVILDQDLAGAYQLAFDAARKAVAADMAANGYRARSNRAHAAVVAYAEEALAGHADAHALSGFDRMRRLRNRTEYGAVTLGRAQVAADLVRARTIVEAVDSRLSRQTNDVTLAESEPSA